MSPSHDHGIEITNFPEQLLPVVKLIPVLCVCLINDFVGKFRLMAIVNIKSHPLFTASAHIFDHKILF